MNVISLEGILPLSIKAKRIYFILNSCMAFVLALALVPHTPHAARGSQHLYLHLLVQRVLWIDGQKSKIKNCQNNINSSLSFKKLKVELNMQAERKTFDPKKHLNVL